MSPARRVVLVTGCSTGIGRTTAIALGRRGHRVYATMRTPERATDLRSLVDAEGLDVELVALDVTDDASVRAGIERAVQREGRLDAVVNNAGVGPFGPVERTTDADWLAAFDTNLFGAVRVTRAALPVMRAQGSGTVVNVSSIAGRLAASPTHSVYAASKHALCAFTDALVAEVAPFGLSAVCVEPGFFATAIMDKDVAAPLAIDDPYRAVSDEVQAFFRAAVAAAPPPDAVAELIAAAVEGTLAGGIHHAVGHDGAPPTESAERLRP